MNIKLNGSNIRTDCITAFEVKDSIFDTDCIVIVNGFQIQSDYILTENDEVTVIKKGFMPDKEQLESMMAARHTPKVHEKLKKSRVAVAGLGGLGSNLAVSLARIGVGELFLVDFDVVEPSNLNRQSYYVSHLGMNKTEALKSQLQQINPFITIKTETVRVDENNAVRLFSGYDVVCEAFDNAVAKAMLVSTLLLEVSGVKIVAASGMAGYDSSNKIRTERKLKNLYVCGDGENEAQIGKGLMAPRVQICSGHQANMVLRLLLGVDGE